MEIFQDASNVPHWDITVLVSGTKFHCHKVKLCTAFKVIGYLMDLVPNSNEVTLPERLNIAADAFAVLLCLVYASYDLAGLGQDHELLLNLTRSQAWRLQDLDAIEHAMDALDFPRAILQDARQCQACRGQDQDQDCIATHAVGRLCEKCWDALSRVQTICLGIKQGTPSVHVERAILDEPNFFERISDEDIDDMIAGFRHKVDGIMERPFRHYTEPYSLPRFYPDGYDSTQRRVDKFIGFMDEAASKAEVDKLDDLYEQGKMLDLLQAVKKALLLMRVHDRSRLTCAQLQRIANALSSPSIKFRTSMTRMVVVWSLGRAVVTPWLIEPFADMSEPERMVLRRFKAAYAASTPNTWACVRSMSRGIKDVARELVHDLEWSCRDCPVQLLAYARVY